MSDTTKTVILADDAPVDTQDIMKQFDKESD
jgi:hypothetical protein